MGNKILMTSEKAAQFKTITGWVSRGGHFYGDDERGARKAGCTHLVCDCGNEYPRNSYCETCRERKQSERFANLPFKEWDGEEPVVIFNTDQYFFTKDDLWDFFNDHEGNPADEEFCICVPQYASEIEPDEYYCDFLDEDHYLYDCSPELDDKFRDLNKFIREEKIILSWIPGKHRTSITAEMIK